MIFSANAKSWSPGMTTISTSRFKSAIAMRMDGVIFALSVYLNSNP